MSSFFWYIKQLKAVVYRKKNLTFVFQHLGTKQEIERNAGSIHAQYTEIRIKDGFGIKTGTVESFTQCLCF